MKTAVGQPIYVAAIITSDRSVVCSFVRSFIRSFIQDVFALDYGDTMKQQELKIQSKTFLPEIDEIPPGIYFVQRE